VEKDMTKNPHDASTEVDPVFVRLQNAQVEYLAALQEVWNKILQQYAAAPGNCASAPQTPPRSK
jgi:hypothetical protein